MLAQVGSAYLVLAMPPDKLASVGFVRMLVATYAWALGAGCLLMYCFRCWRKK